MIGPIDFTKRFIPEVLTPLYHTPSYAQLTPGQQLRYNQLHATYFNEQTIFFESAMAKPLLREVIKHCVPKDLAVGLRVFLAEEEQHSQMFRALNRACFPERYAESDRYFIRLPAWAAACLGCWVRYPRLFPFFLWVLLIQEERALFCANQFLAGADALESNFVAAQQRHLADESGHIQWDEQLLDWIWPRIIDWHKQLNAKLFAWIMGEYFTTPKRSGLSVVAELVREFVELKSVWPQLRDQTLRLSEHREFNLLSYSRRVTPRSFARFDRWPAFSSLGGALVGYEPCPAAQVR